MSQISLEKKEFSPDECLPNFNLKFDFFERPKNPPDFALLGSREKKGIDKNRFLPSNDEVSSGTICHSTSTRFK